METKKSIKVGYSDEDHVDLFPRPCKPIAAGVYTLLYND